MKPRAEVERMKAEMLARIQARRRVWLLMFENEIFFPSFPPQLGYHSYPARTPTGSLIIWAELVMSGPNFHLIQHAEDGTEWLTVHESLPMEFPLI